MSTSSTSTFIHGSIHGKSMYRGMGEDTEKAFPTTSSSSVSSSSGEYAYNHLFGNDEDNETEFIIDAQVGCIGV